ncbi:hypothetical protein N6L24_04185 [Cognatishimia sp. SS12]|uniref:hypothetical protein n=1 Tax=Cognatishimia sp. SS12 TaxID=2979465 RepID=UPI0023310EDF|nr:hypothetical protein [Cognatishimia sp. SS12]MDC0737463.1 hypothetical protein [Cognatishimia sp. SS12]
MALHFDKGDAFAFDKPAGTPCPNLAPDSFGCRIHADLMNKGFGGCVKFDCRGAGQRVTQEVFAGITWRDAPDQMRQMIDAFRMMRRLHETLEAIALLQRYPLSPPQSQQLDAFLAELTAPESGWTVSSLTALDASDVFDRFKAALPAFRSAVSRA